MGKCKHCQNGFFQGQPYGEDVECINGVLIDVDVYSEGWARDEAYPVAPCHPSWRAQQRGREFLNDCQKRLLAAAGE